MQNQNKLLMDFFDDSSFSQTIFLTDSFTTWTVDKDEIKNNEPLTASLRYAGRR